MPRVKVPGEIGSSSGKKRERRIKENGIEMFRSKTKMNSWEGFEAKRVHKGRFVAIEDFEELQLEEKFEAIKWSPILHICERTYPKLVRLFYCNLVMHPNGESLTSLVKGQDITLTVGLLARLLGLPNVGAKVYFWPKEAFGDINISKERVYKAICKTYNPKEEVIGMHLKEEARVIALIMQYNVIPRGGNRSQVFPFEALLIAAVMEGWPLHLPYVILSCMGDLENKPKSGLPFGMLLTLVFNHFDVDLEGEDSELPPEPINKASLSKMRKSKRSRRRGEPFDSLDSPITARNYYQSQHELSGHLDHITKLQDQCLAKLDEHGAILKALASHILPPPPEPQTEPAPAPSEDASNDETDDNPLALVPFASPHLIHEEETSPAADVLSDDA